jgi:hypothetical protein
MPSPLRAPLRKNIPNTLTQVMNDTIFCFMNNCTVGDQQIVEGARFLSKRSLALL